MNLERHLHELIISPNIEATEAKAMDVVDTENAVDSVDSVYSVDIVDVVDTVDAVELETALKACAPVATFSIILQMHAESGDVLRREETMLSTFVSSVASQDMSKSIISPTNV